MPIPIAQPHTDLMERQRKQSNGSHAQLHTPTTYKSNAIPLIKQLESCSNNRQKQFNAIDKSMKFMFMHIARISIKQWTLRKNWYINYRHEAYSIVIGLWFVCCSAFSTPTGPFTVLWLVCDWTPGDCIPNDWVVIGLLVVLLKPIRLWLVCDWCAAQWLLTLWLTYSPISQQTNKNTQQETKQTLGA